MRRILFWTNAYAPMLGGAEIWAHRYLSALRSRGHAIQVIVVTDTDGPIEDRMQDGIDQLWLPLRRPMDRQDPGIFKTALDRAEQAISAFAPDIVQISNFGVGSLLLARLMRRHLEGRPILLTAHNVWLDDGPTAAALLDGTARRSTRAATFHPSVADWLHRRWPGLPVTVIPHAVPPSPDPAGPIPAGAPFLFCGRLSPEKGALVLIEAFARLLVLAPEARLVIAGDGIERDRIEAAIGDRGLAHAITLAGAVSPAAVSGFIDRSIAVVMPSFSEGFGLVAAEAAWRGRATIASNVGGLPSTVIDGRTGLLCPPGDADALCEAMLGLHRAPDRAAHLGRAARREVERRPDWAGHVDAFERLLDELAASHRHGSPGPTIP